MELLWDDIEKDLNDFQEVRDNQFLKGFVMILSGHSFINGKDLVRHVVEFYKNIVKQTTTRSARLHVKLYKARQKERNVLLKKGYDAFIDMLDDITSRRKTYMHDVLFKYKYQGRNYSKNKKK